MYSRRRSQRIAIKARYPVTPMIVAGVFGALGLWHGPNCLAAPAAVPGFNDSPQIIGKGNRPESYLSLRSSMDDLVTAAPLDFHSFLRAKGAILDGAGLLTRFKQNGQYWLAHIEFNRTAAYAGECNSTHIACPLPENLFFDNVPKKRVMTLSAVGPGSWFLDYASGTVYMGDNPAGYTVELSLAGRG